MPSPEPIKKPVGMSPEEREAFFNRIAVGMAKREAIVDSWFTAAGVPIPPKKSDEQLKAEDAVLFRNEPPYLGLGAPIPSWWLVSEAQNNNKSLRDKFFPGKGLHGSKSRDKEEKEGSAKRGLRVESSDEDEGRSGLGRAKKMKMSKRVEPTANMGYSNSRKEYTESAEAPTHTFVTAIKRVKSKQIQHGMVDSSEQKVTASGEGGVESSLYYSLQDVTIDTDERIDCARIKEEHMRSKQEPPNIMIVDSELGKTSKRGKEQRLIPKRDFTYDMDVNSELEEKRAAQERKRSKPKWEERERSHSQEAAEKKASSFKAVEKSPALFTVVDFKYSGEGRDSVTSSKPESEESVGGREATHFQGTLVKDQRRREKKKKKREKKRLLEAAKKTN